MLSRTGTGNLNSTFLDPKSAALKKKLLNNEEIKKYDEKLNIDHENSDKNIMTALSQTAINPPPLPSRSSKLKRPHSPMPTTASNADTQHQDSLEISFPPISDPLPLKKRLSPKYSRLTNLFREEPSPPQGADEIHAHRYGS